MAQIVGDSPHFTLDELLSKTRQYLGYHPADIPENDLPAWNQRLVHLLTNFRRLPPMQSSIPQPALDVHRELVRMWDYVHGRICKFDCIRFVSRIVTFLLYSGLQSLRIDRVIRETIYGSVYLGSYKGARAAIKKSVQRLGFPQAGLEDPVHEVEVHYAITRNPCRNIVQQYDKFLTREMLGDGANRVDCQCVWTALEFCADGELFDFISERSVQQITIPEVQACSYAYQVLQAVRAIFASGHVHLDISLENVLLTDNQQTAKICDFGMARKYRPNEPFPGHRARQPGKKGYRAPEICAGQDFYGPSADMWSCGVLIFILLTGMPPYEEANDSDPRFKCLFTDRNLKLLLRHWGFIGHPNGPRQQLSDAAVDLVSRLLVPAAERFTVDQALNHAWFAPLRLAEAQAHANLVAANTGVIQGPQGNVGVHAGALVPSERLQGFPEPMVAAADPAVAPAVILHNDDPSSGSKPSPME